jgi:hypothetical protein
MTPLDLKNELVNDPTSLGYDITNPLACVALINNQNFTIQQSIPISVVLIWAASTGALAKFQTRANNSSDPLQSAAQAILLNIQGGIAPLDVTNPAVDGMVSAFQTVGDFTSDQKTALYQMSQMTGSRAEVLWGIAKIIYIDDILTALRQ